MTLQGSTLYARLHAVVNYIILIRISVFHLLGSAKTI
jgi:hypothetical protein